MTDIREDRTLIELFTSGHMNRRSFLRHAAISGLSAGAVIAALGAAPAFPAYAQDAVPQPTGPREDGTPVADDQQILRMVTPSPFRMDPPTYGGDLWQLQMLVFQCLTRVDADGSLVPGIADSWTPSDDATVWTFALNPEAKFSDGTPITANDVKWSFEWIANPASQSTSADLATGKIVGYDKVRDGSATTLDGIVVKDDHTIEFTLSSPTSYFDAVVGHYSLAILKQENVESGEEWWRAPVTSGFFKVTEYTPGDQATMTLERNEHWFREPAKLSKITMQLVADPQTQLVQYDNGEIDGMVCQPAEFARATKPGGERAADLFWDIADATWYFGFAAFKEPFDDIKVRQAFASALDLNAISIAGLNGIYPPQPRILRSGFPGGGDEQWQPTFDVDRAKQLISESTYGSVDKLPKITIIISEQGGATALGTWGKVATVIQQMLQQNLGVEVELVRQVFNSVAEQVDFINTTEGGAIFRLSFGAPIQDPSYISPIGKTGGSSNITGYSNPELDDIIDQADAGVDPAKRLELYAQIDKTLSEDAVFLAPFRGTSTWFFKPQVRGMTVVLGRIWNSIHQMYIAE
ncbi:MAG TPA: peptide ABC transporter substrate-binding protein [Thermomicrobiales bacterium]|nr:peptide ABC transporter substrate-binding protein [Thermomicrobiales bacterium]